MCVHIHSNLMMFKDLMFFCTGLCNPQEICILPESLEQVKEMDLYTAQLLFQKGTQADDVATVECDYCMSYAYFSTLNSELV